MPLGADTTNGGSHLFCSFRLKRKFISFRAILRASDALAERREYSNFSCYCGRDEFITHRTLMNERQ